MNMQEAIQSMVEHHDLDGAAMTEIMRTIMTGEATPAQIAGFLIGLRMKGETVEEITAAANVMRELATPVRIDHPHLVDIVGTGGDSASTFNISTASIFVAAAAGAAVAKHGNRSVSSSSGSADLLEAAGINLQLTPEQVAQCVEEVGVGFMFAPRHHAAIKHAIGPRKEMGVRTLFNILGPLTNPAKTPNILLGVFDQSLVEPLAAVLQGLGTHHALVVHALCGLDEISIEGETVCAELHQGEIQTYSIKPSDFGIVEAPLDKIRVKSPQESLAVIEAVFDNVPGPARDAVVLNAGAAIYVAGLTETLAAGVEQAAVSVASGAAKAKLAALKEKTRSFA